MKQQARDFDSSGLGIGGAGRHDLAAEEAELIARGEMVAVEPQCSYGGQLWEPCPICGKEPVHLDCGYCDVHCPGAA